jgi:Vacuolar protein sorting-associated protein 35
LLSCSHSSSSLLLLFFFFCACVVHFFSLSHVCSAGNCGFGRIAADFLAQALVLYEEKLAEDAEVMEALTLVSGTLEHLAPVIESEKYMPLARKTAKFSHRHLLKKPDQCRSILRSTHLFGGEKVCGVCGLLPLSFQSQV